MNNAELVLDEDNDVLLDVFFLKSQCASKGALSAIKSVHRVQDWMERQVGICRQEELRLHKGDFDAELLNNGTKSFKALLTGKKLTLSLWETVGARCTFLAWT